MSLAKRNKFNVCNVTERLRFCLCPDSGGGLSETQMLMTCEAESSGTMLRMYAVQNQTS
jgi:hypothetical protein